ncbi:putative leader peptide [Streptomyces sp. NPDC029080]
MKLSADGTGVCVALVARRHVDLCRHASAICR